jgi:hypothetical protein
MFRLDRIGAMTQGERFAVEKEKTLAAFYRRMEDECLAEPAHPRPGL